MTVETLLIAGISACVAGMGVLWRAIRYEMRQWRELAREQSDVHRDLVEVLTRLEETVRNMARRK